MIKKRAYQILASVIALMTLGVTLYSFSSSQIEYHALTSSASGSVPVFNHIFQITLENTSIGHILGDTTDAPYMNSLVNQGGLAQQFYAWMHPSLPNYFTLTAGSTLGISNDCGSTQADCPQNARSIVQNIESSGRSWKAYFESLPPGNSDCGYTRTWPYTPHYNPFAYYSQIKSSGECNHVVPYSNFASDLNSGSLANYIWISPSLCNDGHLYTSSSGTCPNGVPSTYPPAVHNTDVWLSQNIPQILQSQAYQNNGLLIITYDEGDDDTTIDSSGCCGGASGGHIFTLLLSPLIHPGTVSNTSETSYNLLKTIETSWSLPSLANEASYAPMSEFFTQSTPTPTNTPTATPTATPTHTPTPTSNPTSTPTSSPSHTPTPTSYVSNTPTTTVGASHTPTPIPTGSGNYIYVVPSSSVSNPSTTSTSPTQQTVGGIVGINSPTPSCTNASPCNVPSGCSDCNLIPTTNEVLFVDSNNNPLVGAQVVFVSTNGTRTFLTTDPKGSVMINQDGSIQDVTVNKQVITVDSYLNANEGYKVVIDPSQGKVVQVLAYSTAKNLSPIFVWAGLILLAIIAVFAYEKRSTINMFIPHMR